MAPVNVAMAVLDSDGRLVARVGQTIPDSGGK
jgi:hypothetical protein